MATASNAAPSTVIAPPQLTPPRLSLLSSADRVTTSGDVAATWTRGFTYAPEGCGDAGIGVVCETITKSATPNGSLVQVNPFYIYAADKCSTWSSRERDFYGRAERKLLASESYWLEHELMLDSLNLGNPHIISPAATIVTAGPVNPVLAIAALENALATCMKGGRAMIHVRPGMLVLLEAAHAVRREGNLWLTSMDNIVVPGRGYPGSSPAGVAPTLAVEWIYATSMVQVYEDKVIMTPPQAPSSDSNPQGLPTAAIDRSVNDVFVVAERMVGVAFDPNCCVLAAETSRVVV